MKILRFLFHSLIAANLFIAPWAQAEAPPSSARTEINILLSKLESSGCSFNRNGSWHTPSEAKTHLLKKLNYLEEKGRLENTEQFIDLAATKSSMSGKAYLVKCGSTEAISSSEWLTTQLQAMRSTEHSATILKK